MPKKSPKVPTFSVIIYLAPFIAAGLAFLVAVNTDGLPRLAAMVVLGAFAIWIALAGLDRDPIAAWENERINDAAPWLMRNEDIGKSVVALADFEQKADGHQGKVSLDGEIWNAICKDGSRICKGARVFVVARESLTVVVSASEESVPGGMPS